MAESREMAEVLLTALVTVFGLTAVTGWALVAYLMVRQQRRIEWLQANVDAFDRDIADLWQATFPMDNHGHAQIPAEILPFIKRPIT